MINTIILKFSISLQKIIQQTQFIGQEKMYICKFMHINNLKKKNRKTIFKSSKEINSNLQKQSQNGKAECEELLKFTWNEKNASKN